MIKLKSKNSDKKVNCDNIFNKKKRYVTNQKKNPLYGRHQNQKKTSWVLIVFEEEKNLFDKKILRFYIKIVFIGQY